MSAFELVMSALHIAVKPVRRWLATQLFKTKFERVKKIVCYYQAEIIQQSFLLGEEHKRLRKSIEAYRPLRSSAEKLRNAKVIKDRTAKIERDVGEAIDVASNKLFETLENYFTSRNKREDCPRL
ncbi:MAG: hypothetical protein KKA55_00470 [Proteobacteria bacterium]|nr:hypothetical protein [Pseudomonadota bacterium]MBU1593989.1 hypothetical protein [Pseudomonadota bacterium]